jgi:hypothetical protein
MRCHGNVTARDVSWIWMSPTLLVFVVELTSTNLLRGGDDLLGSTLLSGSGNHIFNVCAGIKHELGE